MSTKERKIRDIMDKIESGEEPLGSIAVDTRRSDEGSITSTVSKRCGPCNAGNHGRCEGGHVCNCDHPSHHQGQT